VGQFHWDPETYLELMREELPVYDRLQDEVVQGAAELRVRRILDLGVGTGETAARVLALYPEAALVGVDASPAMLAHARSRLGDRPDLRVGRLEAPLPEGGFDLVISALAVHHLDADGKRDLFQRVADALTPGGRFVLADVVVPERDEDAVTPLSPDYDLPDPLDDQLRWLDAAGLRPRVLWAERDLAVVAAEPGLMGGTGDMPCFSMRSEDGEKNGISRRRVIRPNGAA
jgi:tRNA (cmo5U34)-methyltransferase